MPGTFRVRSAEQVITNGKWALFVAGISGNARQRRLYIRRWKKKGFFVYEIGTGRKR